MRSRTGTSLAAAMVITLAACAAPGPTPPTLPPATATQHAINQAGLYAARSDGTYLIGVHMAHGVWQLDSAGVTGDECYWLTRHADGIILQSYLGPPTAQQVTFGQYDYELIATGCGAWQFLGTPTPTPPPSETPSPTP